jgi:hypothetical protein
MKKCSSRRPRRRSRVRIRPEDGASSGFFSTLLVGVLRQAIYSLDPARVIRVSHHKILRRIPC